MQLKAKIERVIEGCLSWLKGIKVKRRKILLILLLLLTGGMILLGWLIRRPWPSYQGEKELSGLYDVVEVFRDPYGVPHIFARNPHDLFFVQGYVMAQDRLWQMDILRRVARGELSEVFGKRTLFSDIFMRTVGLRRVAEGDLLVLKEETKRVLDAFSQGVNASLEEMEREGKLSLIHI